MKEIIIPTLFALDKETFKKKLEALNFAKNLHIDFMDKSITPKKSLSLEEIKEEVSKYENNSFEIHMMCKNPEKYLEQINQIKNIKKIIIHYEGFEHEEELFKFIENFKKNKNIQEIFLCFNPNKSTRLILDTLSKIYNNKIKKIDGIQLMSVFPGAEGQKFIEKTLERINKIRKEYQELNIQIDGGIKGENIKEIKNSGANLFSIGSFISNSENPKKTYENLIYLINY
jgi:ribulose-phosphate 3-epimerase